MHIPSAKRQCRENIISTSILEKIKKENIPNAVRMVHDKNPGEITEECPYRYYLRLQNELFDISTNDTKKLKGKSFLRINNLNHSALLQKMRQTYEKLSLHNIHKWTEGKIPRAYCNVKNKDNNKSRLISASQKAAIRRIL